MTTDELIRKVGDPDVLARELFQASKDVKTLEGRWDELIAAHRDEWVGVLHGELLFANSLESLISRAQREKWDVGAMVVDHLKDDRSTMMF